MDTHMLDRDELSAYATRVSGLDGDDYVGEVRRQVLASAGDAAYAAADQRVGVLYRDAVARGRMPLYQRGHAAAAHDRTAHGGTDDRRLARAA